MWATPFTPITRTRTIPTNKNVLGRGICIKEASTQSYATDSEAVAIMQQICEAEGIPYQKFANRSDGTSGSTLGSIASSFYPVKTVDIGVPPAGYAFQPGADGDGGSGKPGARCDGVLQTVTKKLLKSS